jgi:hypothetical protein
MSNLSLVRPFYIKKLFVPTRLSVFNDGNYKHATVEFIKLQADSPCCISLSFLSFNPTVRVDLHIQIALRFTRPLLS